MYIRWKKQPTSDDVTLKAYLVRSERINRYQTKQRIIGFIASIHAGDVNDVERGPAARKQFWAQANEHLAQLKLGDMLKRKLVRDIEETVPPKVVILSFSVLNKSFTKLISETLVSGAKLPCLLPIMTVPSLPHQFSGGAECCVPCPVEDCAATARHGQAASSLAPLPPTVLSIGLSPPRRVRSH